MAVFNVTNFNDSGAGSLREAIGLANANGDADEIMFASAGTLTLVSALPTIFEDVSIDGDLGDDGIADVVIDANADGDANAATFVGKDDTPASARRVLDISGIGVEATLDGLILTGGATTETSFTGRGGGIRADGFSELTLNSTTVIGNSATGSFAFGGGVYGGTLTLNNSVVSDNFTDGYGSKGGGVFGGNVSLNNSTVANNSTAADTSDGGGVFGTTVTLTNSSVIDNRTGGPYSEGGGIRGNTVTLIDSSVINNSTGGPYSEGGGVFGTTVTLTNSSVIDNRTAGPYSAGGGISGYTVSLVDSDVSDNATSGIGSAGGGIFGDFGDVTLTNTLVSNNSTAGEDATGGGIQNGGILKLYDSTVSGNSTAGYLAEGGGIFNRGPGSYATITESVIKDNSTAGIGAEGGGISAIELTLSNSAVHNNSTSGAASGGGGISTLLGPKFYDSTISDNSTAGLGSQGGGVYSYGTANLTRSTISGNSTSGNAGSGGGVYSYNGVLATDSTIANNKTNGFNADGGGIRTAYTVFLENSTVTGNSTAGGSAEGGGISSGAYTGLTNSLVVGNVSQYATGNEIVGTVVNDGFSIAGGNAALVFAETVNNGGVQAGVVKDNGGPTETVAILEGGLADGTADPTTATATDQRGIMRDAAPDLGAFERQSTVVAASSDAEQKGSQLQLVQSSNNTGNDDLELGIRDAVAWRFTDVAIPTGAKIINAFLTVTAEANGSGAADFDIMLEDSGAAAMFSNASKILDRDYLDLSVDWSFDDPWFTGQTFETTNLAPLVQALLNSTPEADGTYDLVFKIDGDGSRRVEPEEAAGGAFATTLTLEISTEETPGLVLIGQNKVANNLVGGAGDDFLAGLGGLDFHDGMGGNDTVDISHTSVDADVDLTTGTLDFGPFGVEQALNIENIIATHGDNRIVGTDEDNVIDGKGGTDTVLYALAADKYLVTGPDGTGAFTVTGPEGTDTLLNIEQLNFAGSINDVAIEDFIVP